jgi:hypothetical protein
MALFPSRGFPEQRFEGKLDSITYRQSPPCTETALPETPESSGKRKRKTVAA